MIQTKPECSGSDSVGCIVTCCPFPSSPRGVPRAEDEPVRVKALLPLRGPGSGGFAFFGSPRRSRISSNRCIAYTIPSRTVYPTSTRTLRPRTPNAPGRTWRRPDRSRPAEAVGKVRAVDCGPRSSSRYGYRPNPRRALTRPGRRAREVARTRVATSTIGFSIRLLLLLGLDKVG
jgi:hypothetical protein